MTWEQELRIQSKEIGEKIAQQIAQQIAQTKVDESKLETAKKLLKTQLKLEQISECTGLPLEQVLQLQKEVMSPVAK